jgi:POT family proton-dependent oligopeptide transporter
MVVDHPGAREPASPTKFSFGLIGVGIGFSRVGSCGAPAAMGARVSPAWLTATYLIHHWAELSLSPVA